MGFFGKLFEKKMLAASEALDYEKAAYYRDRMLQLEKMQKGDFTDDEIISADLKNLGWYFVY